MTTYLPDSKESKSTIAKNVGRLEVVTITTDPALTIKSTHTKYLYMLGTTMEKHLQKVVWS